MKMWNISVAPMPSSISMPLASSRAGAWRPAAPSPALTQMRSGARRAGARLHGAIWR
jgi:hypothetical protein